MQWALRNFENKRLFRKGELITTIDVALGMDKQVPVTVGKDIFITIPISASGSMRAEITYEQPKIAPVKINETQGTLRIIIPGYGQVEEPLVAAESVNELDFFGKTLAKARYFFLKQY
jgi:D-alanyl-D-alanine carboxypeptidase (penicillin-binding protein 5/6)